MVISFTRKRCSFTRITSRVMGLTAYHMGQLDQIKVHFVSDKWSFHFHEDSVFLSLPETCDDLIHNTKTFVSSKLTRAELGAVDGSGMIVSSSC